MGRNGNYNLLCGWCWIVTDHKGSSFEGLKCQKSEHNPWFNFITTSGVLQFESCRINAIKSVILVTCVCEQGAAQQSWGVIMPHASLDISISMVKTKCSPHSSTLFAAYIHSTLPPTHTRARTHTSLLLTAAACQF